MGYGIFRITKLKTMGNLKGSLMHALREQETPNADKAKLKDNVFFTAENTVANILQKYEKLKPEKIRADQVRAIEVLVTASPETMEKMTKDEQINYLKEALVFANKEFGGEQNLLHAQIHEDETTPHLTAFYIPLVEKRNKNGEVKKGLNAKVLMGGKKEFSNRQTRFYEKVSKKYGLERGEIGSKATHKTIRDYYRGLSSLASIENIKVEKVLCELKERSIDSVDYERKGIIRDTIETIDLEEPHVPLNRVVQVLKHSVEKANRSKFAFAEERRKAIKREKEQLQKELKKKHEEELEKEKSKSKNYYLDLLFNKALKVILLELGIKEMTNKFSDVLDRIKQEIAKLVWKCKDLEAKNRELIAEVEKHENVNEQIASYYYKEKGERVRLSSRIEELNRNENKLKIEINGLTKKIDDMNTDTSIRNAFSSRVNEIKISLNRNLRVALNDKEYFTERKLALSNAEQDIEKLKYFGEYLVTDDYYYKFQMAENDIEVIERRNMQYNNYISPRPRV